MSQEYKPNYGFHFFCIIMLASLLSWAQKFRHDEVIKKLDDIEKRLEVEKNSREFKEKKERQQRD